MGAIVFVGRSTIRPGGLEAIRVKAAATAAYVEANHPRHLLLEFFFDEDAGVMTTLQVHPDEESFRLHMRLGAESGHFASAGELITSSAVTLYGDVGDDLVATVSAIARGGPVEIHREPVGFERLSART